MAGRGRGERCSRTGLARVCGDVRLGGWRVSCGRAPSGWEWNRSQPCQGATELGFPRPALWQMQGEAACRAGEPSGQGEEPSPKGLGGRDLLAQTDPRRPAGQVVGHHLYRQPSAALLNNLSPVFHFTARLVVSNSLTARLCWCLFPAVFGLLWSTSLPLQE